MNLRKQLERRLAAAFVAAGAPDGTPALVAPSAKPQFGDYQANGAMAAAKKLKTNPRRFAEQVVAAAELDDLAEKLEVAGPGFINITLKTDLLNARLAEALADAKLGVEQADPPQTVVVDYSAPNLAKEMHVGHLRSTIIGDALARTLELVGEKVIRQNHVGDWGTQFGMLVAYAEATGVSSKRVEHDTFSVTVGGGPGIEDMEEFYREAKRKFEKRDVDGKTEFADKARRYVVLLQQGDWWIHALWEFVVSQSLSHAKQVYDRLGVTLTPDDVRGESAYNDDLPKVIDDLRAAGLLTESRGAQCVFLDQFTGKDGEPLPLIVQKSDEGYLYATTDLAAIRYRCGELHADRVLYVVDARQALHFRQVFAVAREAGFAPESVSLEHIGFGTMQGADGKPFKTREGGTVKLMALLDEAVDRAYELVTEKSPDLAEDRRRDIARVVGIGAVKYADLSQNRQSDYVFLWDKMLSLEGNTAPYMQYAYARVKSIFRKGGLVPETGAAVAAECLPNTLCSYLYGLAGAFMGFYENCPVLQADEPVRTSRRMLCHLTAETIRTGLGLLGIETVEQM